MAFWAADAGCHWESQDWQHHLEPEVKRTKQEVLLYWPEGKVPTRAFKDCLSVSESCSTLIIKTHVGDTVQFGHVFTCKAQAGSAA